MKKNAEAFDPIYAAVIETLDDAVGLLLKKLDELKLADNTIVVFTSDNGGLHVPEGPHQKITHNTPYRAGKGFLYEGGIRVPLIVRWPGQVKAGQTLDVPVITTDWLPTLLELTGGKVPAGLDGVSLAGLLTGRGNSPERNLFWHLPHYTNQGSRPSGAIRAGRVEADRALRGRDVGAVRPGGRPRRDRPRVAASAHRPVAGSPRHLAAGGRAQGNASNPNFDPALHRELYIDVDPSKYEPAKATAAEFDRMQEWRKQMNAVVPKRKKK